MRKVFLPAMAAILLSQQACSFYNELQNREQPQPQTAAVKKILQAQRQNGEHPLSYQEKTAEKTSLEQKTNGAYFYFLRGCQQEYHKQYDDALASYTKALHCAPTSSYIKRKIPGLLFSLQRYEETLSWLENALIQEPENTFYLQLLGGTYLLQKKIEKGIAVYAHLLKLQPDDEELVSRLAIIHLQTGNSPKAINLLRKFIKQHPQTYIPRVTLARIYSQNEQYSKAATLFEEAQQLHWTEEIAADLAHSYRKLGKLRKAEELYRKIIADGLRYEEAAFMLTKLFVDEEKYSQALYELEQIRPKSNNSTWIDYSRSQILLKQNRRKEAKELLQTLIKTNSHNDACYLLAVLAYQDKDPQTCTQYLQRIEKDSTRFHQAIFLQARIYEDQRAYDKAVNLLKNKLPKEDRTPFFYTVLAFLYQAQKKENKANSILHTGLVKYPDSAELLYNLGLLYEQQGKHELALKIMEKLIIAQPNHVDALNFLGYSWTNDNTNLSQAYKYIRKANRLEPDNAFILDSLGWVLYRMGKLCEANEILEKARLLLPENHIILEHLGDVNFALQHYKNAERYYTKARKYAPTPPEQQQIKEKLEQLEQAANSSVDNKK